MKIIGFSNKFYTLWEVTTSVTQLAPSHSRVITRYEYIKNISMDIDVVSVKYPGVMIDESLNGKTKSWESSKDVWEDLDVFRFGKYKYENIDENGDTRYISWYWTNIYDEHKAYVSCLLERRGYEVRRYDNGEEYLMSPEDLEKEQKELEEFYEIADMIFEKKEFEFTPKSNLHEDGNYCLKGHVVFHFPEIKRYCYEGYDFYLPVMDKKAKRIKNKTIVVKEYKYSKIGKTTIQVDVSKFEIKKQPKTEVA